MSSAAKNLEAIDNAIDKHDNECPYELIAIEMCGYEVERLGWDEYRGIPIREADDLGTGRFRLVCENDIAPQDQVEVEEAVPA